MCVYFIYVLSVLCAFCIQNRMSIISEVRNFSEAAIQMLFKYKFNSCELLNRWEIIAYHFLNFCIWFSSISLRASRWVFSLVGMFWGIRLSVMMMFRASKWTRDWEPSRLSWMYHWQGSWTCSLEWMECQNQMGSWKWASLNHSLYKRGKNNHYIDIYVLIRSQC